MKKVWRISCISCAILGFGIGLTTAVSNNAKAATNTAGWFYHTVEKGESLSLICIRYFGHYSGMMGDAVLKLNPSMKNVNNLKIGQRLKLAKPVSGTGDGTSVTSRTFVRTLAITQGVVTWVSGDAWLTPANGDVRSALKANTVIYPGDQLETGGDGRVEIIINRESVVRLKEDTRLTLQVLRKKKGESGKTSLKFDVGTVWTKVKKFADQVSRFQLELPTAVAGVRGTVYQTTVNADSSGEVKVFNGEVNVSNRTASGEENRLGPDEVPGPHEVSMSEWTHIVRKMQRIHIGKQGAPSAPESFKKDPGDSWETWNEQRDTHIAEILAESR